MAVYITHTNPPTRPSTFYPVSHTQWTFSKTSNSNYLGISSSVAPNISGKFSGVFTPNRTGNYTFELVAKHENYDTACHFRIGDCPLFIEFDKDYAGTGRDFGGSCAVLQTVTCPDKDTETYYGQLSRVFYLVAGSSYPLFAGTRSNYTVPQTDNLWMKLTYTDPSNNTRWITSEAVAGLSGYNAYSQSESKVGNSGQVASSDAKEFNFYIIGGACAGGLVIIIIVAVSIWIGCGKENKKGKSSNVDEFSRSRDSSVYDHRRSSRDVKHSGGTRHGSSKSSRGESRESSGRSSRDSGDRSSRGSGGRSSRDSGDRSSRGSGGRSSRDSGGRSSRGSGGRSSRDSGGRSSRDSGGRSSRGSGGRSSRDSGGRSSRDSDSYTSRGSDSYTSRDGGDRSSRDKGGYTSRDKGGYTNRDRGGYTSRDKGGYTNRDKGGYTNRDKDGYTGRDKGGYTSRDKDGYTGRDNSGYTSRDKGGFTSHDNGGYTGRDKGGFTSHDNGGYTNRSGVGYSTRTGGTHGSRASSDRRKHEKSSSRGRETIQSMTQVCERIYPQPSFRPSSFR